MGNNIHPLHVGIVAGEASGDLLGAGLIEALHEQFPDALFEGVGGPRMQEAGCFSLYPMERLSVMGIAEVVRHLPGLISMRRELGTHFLNNPPDIFIGVDAPDFNLALERRLKRRGIRTLHYVSPSVWAWRQYRVRKIARSIDCMLTLFPFEERFYREHRLPVRCVGHPLADLLADDIDQAQARQHLGLADDGVLVALLPGSRADEVKRLAGPFIGAAAWCRERRPDLEFVVPLANHRCRELFEEELSRARTAIPVTLIEGRSLEAMAAADVALLASGTAALECMLLKRPMVVAYRLSSLTYRIAKRLMKTPYYSLPNLLAGQAVVREVIQDEVNAGNLGRELMSLLDNPGHSAEIRETFSKIHDDLRRDANRGAAQAVLSLVGQHG